MALEFTCSHCGASIIVKYLKPHDVAKCPVCKTDVVVPESAGITEQEPAYLKPTTSAQTIDASVERMIPSCKIHKPYPGVLQTGMLFIIYLCASFFFGIISAFVGMGAGYKLHESVLFAFIVSDLALIVTLWYGYKRTGKKFKEIFVIGSLKSHKWIPFITTNLFFLGFRGIFTLPFFLYKYASASQQEFYNSILEEIIIFEKIGLWPAIIFIIIVGPILEEMIFRGLLLHGYLRRYSRSAAFIISSLLFALLHGNIFSMIPAFALGLFLAWLFVLTRSLLSCILSHMLFNLTAVIVWYCVLPGKGVNPPSPDAGPSMFFTSMLIVISLIVIAAAISIQIKYAKRYARQD